MFIYGLRICSFSKKVRIFEMSNTYLKSVMRKNWIFRWSNYKKGLRIDFRTFRDCRNRESLNAIDEETLLELYSAFSLSGRFVLWSHRHCENQRFIFYIQYIMNFRGNNCVARNGNARVYTTQISSDRTARIPSGRVYMHVSTICTFRNGLGKNFGRIEFPSWLRYIVLSERNFYVK